MVGQTKLLLLVACLFFLVNCASDGGSSRSDSAPRGKVSVCKSGDTTVSSASQCLRDDAACYQLTDGNWCTGTRGNSCPAPSVEVPAGTSCPAGARCFKVGESLTCGIRYQ